jgi:opacity protein-like surface antigen
MKNIVKGALVVGAMLVAGSAAAYMDDVKPYVGVDYYQAYMKAKNGALQNAFPKSYPGASIYAGIKFMENVGAELGADFSKDKSQTAVFSAGTAGMPAGATSVKNEVKRNGGHLDLVGFVPLNSCFNLIGSLGAGMLKAKITSTPNVGSVPVSSKTRTVARIGVGASYMLTDMFGLRAKLNWEGTSALKANINNSGDVKPFKDTTSFTIGAFAQF